MTGVIGHKIGMTQLFSDEGIVTPVTVIRVSPNLVVGERTEDRHGYSALVLGAVAAKRNRLSKPYAGQFGEELEPTKILAEFADYEGDHNVGDRVGVEIFEGVEYVDVSGKTKGKGFQGVMRRHGFRGGVKSHGSKFHRAGGSTGQAAWPSKVFKGTKMAGRMGATKLTTQNLKLVKIDAEKGTLLVKGAVPGRRNSTLFVSKARKK